MRFRTGDFATRHFTTPAACSLLAMLALCACGRYPDSYAPPEQRPTFDDPERWERVIRMTDVDAPDHLVADISDVLAANWRWTGKRPVVHLNIPAQTLLAQSRLKYHIEFAIPQEAFRSTGPVTLTFLVNGHVLDRKQYAAQGVYKFEKDVPPEWLSGGDTTLGAEIDKLFVAKEDGKAYGIILVGIGLKRN